MILSDRSIALALVSGELVVDPLYLPIQPASIDLCLGKEWIFDGRLESLTDFIVLFPGEFVNVCTWEWVEIPPNLVGILVGKSSWARKGLQVESAGYVDPGWKGRLTLELKNLGKDRLTIPVGGPIAQLRLETLTLKALYPYGHKSLNSHFQCATTVEVNPPPPRFVTSPANMGPPDDIRQHLIEHYRLLPSGHGIQLELE